MHGNIVDYISNCELTKHASREIELDMKVLEDRGLNSHVILDAIKRVCENPDNYDRDEGEKRYTCFNFYQHFYLIVVYKVSKSIVKIITVILTTKPSDMLKNVEEHTNYIRDPIRSAFHKLK